MSVAKRQRAQLKTARARAAALMRTGEALEKKSLAAYEKAEEYFCKVTELELALGIRQPPSAREVATLAKATSIYKKLYAAISVKE